MAISKINVGIFADLKQFSTAMENVSRDLNRFSKKLETVGNTLTTRLTLPLALLGGAAIKLGVDFESGMAKITALVGLGADEVAGMKDAVLELSGATSKAPQELADALFVITSAGLRGTDAMNALEYAAKASAAGLGETTDIARSLAGAMNAYGPGVLDAARATDVLVATARAGNFETSQLASSLGDVLPWAKQVGASFEDTGGAIALLTRTNGNAAKSITQVTSLMRAFVVPTEESKKALAALGISAEYMRGAIAEKGLPEALQMLDKMLGGNREQLGKLIGSSEGAGAAFSILNADAQAIADTFGVTAAAAGMTDEAFQVMADTAQFQLNQAMSQAKAGLVDVGLVILDAVMPVIQALSGAIAGLAEWFKNLSPLSKRMAILFAALAASIGPVLLAVAAASKVMAVLTSRMMLLSIKVIAVVAVLAALALAATWVVKNWDYVTQQMGALFDRMRNRVVLSLMKVVDALDRVFGAVGINAFGKLGKQMNGMLVEERKVTAGMQTMGELVQSISSAMSGIFAPTVEDSTTKVDALGDSFTAATESLTELQNKMKYASGLDFTPGKKASGSPAGPQPVGGPVDGGTSGIDWASLESQMNMTERLASRMGGTFVELGDTIRASMVNAAVGIGVFLGQMAAGVEGGISFADVISSAFTDLMGNLGKMMIEAGVAKMAFDLAMLIPGGAIGAILAGTALVAAASALSGSLGGNGTQGVSAPPMLAKGGIAHGPTLVGVGEYSGISTNPEVIAPLNTLRTMISDTQGGAVSGTLQARGRMLQVVLAQDNRVNRRIRP